MFLFIAAVPEGLICVDFLVYEEHYTAQNGKLDALLDCGVST